MPLSHTRAHEARADLSGSFRCPHIKLCKTKEGHSRVKPRAVWSQRGKHRPKLHSLMRGHQKARSQSPSAARRGGKRAVERDGGASRGGLSSQPSFDSPRSTALFRQPSSDSPLDDPIRGKIQVSRTCGHTTGRQATPPPAARGEAPASGGRSIVSSLEEQGLRRTSAVKPAPRLWRVERRGGGAKP